MKKSFVFTQEEINNILLEKIRLSGEPINTKVYKFSQLEFDTELKEFTLTLKEKADADRD